MALGFEYVEILLGLVLCCLVMIIRRRNRQNKTVWPVVGMLPMLLVNVQHIHDYATELLRKYDKTFEFKGPWFVNFDFVITCDPSNIQHILSTNFTNYPKGPEFREVFNVLGDGILNVDSDLWRLQRKMFQLWSRPQNRFDSYVAKTIQKKVVDDLIPFLDQVSETGIQFDLQETFQRKITFDSAILLVFGLDPASYSFKFSNIVYQKAFEMIQEGLLHRHILPRSLWKLQRGLQIGTERKMKMGLEIFEEFMYQCISIKREELSRSGNSNSQKEEEEVAKNLDMMTVYLEEKENPYCDTFLKDVAMNFVAAARDTLTAGLSWFFWLIAAHPSVENKILEELKDNILQAKDDDDDDDYQNKCCSLDVEELNKLVYLQAALYETLRLYPSVPLNHKTADEAEVLPSGHCVKRKQRVLLSFYSMARMEEIWGKDCLEFKPERWISERGTIVYVPSHKYTAFNSGPRTCLGKDMAFTKMKVIAIAVLSKYRVHLVEGHPIYPNITITLNMKHGLKVRLSKRCA